MGYSYSFSEELEQEWQWTERYPTQPEILRYLNHVADRFDLRKDIQLETRVTAAHYDEDANRWTVTTVDGASYAARYLVTAAGCLSTWQVPKFKGLDSFRGDWHHTGNWPKQGVEFSGKRVGVIGTGSTGIQAIPQVARQADHVTVFQRTPNYSIPAHNRPLDPEEERAMKARYREHRKAARESFFGVPFAIGETSALDATPEERQRTYEERWQIGGFPILGSFADLFVDERANETVADFVRTKIRETVKDPETAALLCPRDYPLGTKRICVDIDYFETYNRDNVELVSVRDNPIAEITPTGLRLEDGQEFELDAIVFATGFDALTGALTSIDIRGRDGVKLKEKWEHGPRTYLGVSVAGFPNMFTITGPGSPSVLSNMVVSIEQHVDWIADAIAYADGHGFAAMEATPEAEDRWVDHVNEVANATLYPRANSWYIGANIPGKPRVFMPYVGGVGPYRQQCDEVAAKGYQGFDLSASRVPSAA
jgi:cyclohexanone monooxygenase